VWAAGLTAAELAKKQKEDEKERKRKEEEEKKRQKEEEKRKKEEEKRRKEEEKKKKGQGEDRRDKKVRESLLWTLCIIILYMSVCETEFCLEI
jgi:hypothetical protein